MDMTVNNTIFHDKSEVKTVINSLNYYLALLINDLPYLSNEDTAGIEEEIAVIEELIKKIEEGYPDLYD